MPVLKLGKIKLDCSTFNVANFFKTVLKKCWQSRLDIVGLKVVIHQKSRTFAKAITYSKNLFSHYFVPANLVGPLK